AWVTNLFSGTVSVLRTADHTVSATVPVGLLPRGIGVSAPSGSCSLEDLMDCVTALGPDGDGTLNKGQATALGKKLEQASRFVDKGNIRVAANVLAAFIHQVEDLRDEGVLDDEKADALIGCAESVIENL
ncbi:MAG: hypothetical protein R3326_09980, partial [Gemmatimonadota bacterium]|nr:hypothetical protein [Gemmatimonadota bacterium]